jgi:hypothetical protein
MPFECSFVLTRDCIPQTDGIVSSPTGEDAAIRAKRDAIDLCPMSLESPQFFTGSCIMYQNPDRTGNCETTTIGRIGYLIYFTLTEVGSSTFRQTQFLRILDENVWLK